MSTAATGVIEQPTRAVPMPSHAAELPPASPAPRSNTRNEPSAHTDPGAGFPDAQPKPQYGPRERGLIGLGSAEGTTGSSVVDIKLDMEFEAFDLLDRLMPSLNVQTSDAELTFYSEIIQAKFGKWKTQQELLTLFRKEIEERKKIVGMTEPAPGRIWHRNERDNNRGVALRKFEEKIAKRKKAIKEYINTKGGTDSENQVKLDKLKAIQKELGLDSMDLTDAEKKTTFEAQLSAYVAEKPQYVFDDLTEIVQTYAYIEQVEKDIVLQAGYDIVDSGTRSRQIDFSGQNIRRMTEEGVDPRIVQAMREIGNRIRVRDLRGVEEVIAAGGVGLWEFFGVQLPVTLPVVGTVGTLAGLGGPEAAIAGVTSMIIAKLIGGRIHAWYDSLPEGKALEEVSFPLNFQRVGTELGDSKDPIRQLFRGRIDEAGLFINRCDSLRVGLAKALGVHAGELEGWLNLSSFALGEGASGMELPHRIAFAQQLEKVLVLECPKAGGGHKDLEDLPLDQQLDIINRVSDSVGLVFGAEVKDEIVKNVSIRRVLGLKDRGGVDWSTRKNALTNLNTDITNGKRVFHRKPGAQTLEDAEAEKNNLETRKNRLTQLKDGYQAKIDAYKAKESEYEAAVIESDKTQHIAGYVGTRDSIGRVTVYAIDGGNLEVLNNEKTALEAEIAQINVDIGYDPVTKTYTPPGGLHDKYRDTKHDFDEATKRVTATEARRADAVRLKAELEAQTAKPKLIKAQQKIIEGCDKDLPTLRTNLANADNEYAKYQEDYETRDAQLKKNKARLREIPGEIQAKKKEVLEKEAAAAAARAVRTGELRKVKEILREFGYTEAEMDAVGFAIPTVATLGEKINLLETEFQKKKIEYDQMKTRKDVGDAAVISDEDLELTKMNELVGKSVDTTFLNKLMEDLIEGKMSIEEFKNVTGDAGYNYLLKRVYGEDSLATGPEGKYRMVTQLLSKARLVDAIFEVWHLEGRATTTGFFEGDSEGLRLYQESQFIKQANKRLADKINQLELTKPPPESVAEEITRLRSEFRANGLKQNEMMARLYDRPDRPERRLASFLAQDRMKTAETLRVILDHLYNDALNGFVELSSPPEGARTEQILTSAGTVAVSETQMDIFDRQITQRGEFNVEGLKGYPGVSIDVKLTSDDPATGNIDVVMVIDRDHAGLDKLTNLPQGSHPEELAIVYGTANRRRFAVNLEDFTQEMLDNVPYATRLLATTAHMDFTLINLVYGSDPASGKKSLSQIRKSSIDITALPADRLTVTAPEIVKDLFYYYSGVRRRESLNWSESIPAVIAAHAVLPATRGAANIAGFTLPMLDMFYGANAADTPRSIADITSGKDINGADFNLNALPYEGAAIPASVPTRVRNLLYEVRGRKRQNIDIDGYITSLPANRGGLLGFGLSPEVINLLYEPGVAGSKKSISDLRKIVIPRDHTQITDISSLITLIDDLKLKGSTPTREVFLQNISESFSVLDEVSKTRLLGGKMTAFSVGPTQIIFENGDINVIYINAATGTRFPMKLNEYIMSQAYHPEMGAYLSANPNHKKDVIQSIARNIIETVRRTNI